MTKVIMINGAPRSGKDTLASKIMGYLYHDHDIEVEIFPVKLALVSQTRSFFNVPQASWDNRYVNDKDKPWQELYGLSQREAMIWISEEVVKPKFGKDFYGKLFVNEFRIQEDNPDIVIIPDAGFIEEDIIIVNHFGADNCVMINTHRDGTDFSKDSRSLITGDMLGITGYDFYNNSPIEELKSEIVALVETILIQFEME